MYSLFVPALAHAAPPTSNANATAPPYRRARSATERFKLLRRAASSEPPGSPPMSNASRNGSSPKLAMAPELNTIPDPRASSPLTTEKRSPSSSEPHPDLSNEVATLSAKLITAINNQTNLDDALQDARHELEEARAYISHLEAERREHREALTSGALVKKTDIERKEQRLEKEALEERQKRSSAERQKKGMENELENLTSQLFEEANQMVAAARSDKEKADRRADMYKTKLEDTETLLASQQAQLQQLKDVLQEEQDKPRESIQSSNTAPPTPVVGADEKLSSSTFDHPTHTRNALSTQSLPPPESPLHFHHLIHPVLRTDLQSYEEFVSLLRTNRGSTPPSRSTSGSYTGLNVLGIGTKETTSQSTVIPSLRSITKSSARSTSAQTTPTPGAPNSPDPNSESSSDAVALKDIKYFKRALAEDIEPTLRLDTAPALSWLQRRTVLNSITTGRLMVEPFPPRHAFHSPAYACALCGEVRTSEEHVRRYRFRASDSDEAQRYPVCNYCLTRLRSTCDFTSFLRTAKRGHIKNESMEDCRSAWEECIKLREKMFWSRIGGGVVPAPGSNPVSPVHGAYPETDKESVTQASRSDSDLPSISRADSQRTTSSEQPAMTPLSEAGVSELPSKETLPLDQVMTRASTGKFLEKKENLDETMPEEQTVQMKSASQTTSMPPPPLPEPRQTQPGARDTDPTKPPSTSGSRPESSHASSKAFFEAKEVGSGEVSPVKRPSVSNSRPPSSHSVRKAFFEAKSTDSPSPSSPVNSSNPFKRPSVSTSRPSSRASEKPFDNSNTQSPSSDTYRNSNTFPRPSSSKSTKSFSFGPRDGRAAASVLNANPPVKSTGDDVFESRSVRSNISTPARSPSPVKSAETTPGSHLKDILRPQEGRIPSRPSSQRDLPNPLSDSRRGSVPAEHRRDSETSMPLHIPGTELSKHEDSKAHPVAGRLHTQTPPSVDVEMPSPSMFTRPASFVPSQSTRMASPSPERRPRSSVSQGVDLHLDAPSPPSSNRASKVAALTSRFQNLNDGTQQSRPGSSGSGMGKSPERGGGDLRRGSTPSRVGSPERKSELTSPVKMPGAFT